MEEFKITGATIASVTFGPTVTRYNVSIPLSIQPKKVVGKMIDMSVIEDIKAEIDKIADEPSYQHEGEDWQFGLIIAKNVIDKHISGK